MMKSSSRATFGGAELLRPLAAMDLTPKLLGACLFGSASVAYLVAEHTPLFLVTCILVFLASVLGVALTEL